jgi:hypothetical protein
MAHLRAVKADASVGNLETKRSAGHVEVDAHAGTMARMFDGVLQSLQATKVGSALDRLWKTTKITAVDLDRNDRAPSRG